MFDKVTGMLGGDDYIILEFIISRDGEIDSQTRALDFKRADCNESRANDTKYYSNTG